MEAVVNAIANIKKRAKPDTLLHPSVGTISQFMQNPRTSHLDAVKRILCYINGTADYGLIYKRGDDFLLKGFTDAD